MSNTWRWLRVIGPIVVVLPIILACPTRPIETPRPKDVQQTNKYFPQSLEKDIDILFIIDNSNSMEQEQVNLATNFPKMIEALRSPKLGGAGCTPTNKQACRIPNVHIGAITSDLGAGTYSLPSCEVQGGDGGRLQNTARKPGCPAPKDKYVSYNEGVSNVPSSNPDAVAQVKEGFQCIAEFGVGGCGFEHQLESAKKALEGCGPPNYNCTVNPGFVRKNAFLAVVWITDEDDCSAAKGQLFDPQQQGLSDPLGPLTSFRCTEFGIQCDKNGRQAGIRNNCVPGFDWLVKIDVYTAFFSKIKPPGRVILFAIAGPTDKFEVGIEGSNPILKPTCQSINGTAVPAIRVQSLVKSKVMTDLGHKGYFNEGSGGKAVNICSTDFSPALELLGEVIVASLGGQCISSPPLTKSGSVACQAGDVLAPGVTCAASCLEKVDCVIQEVTNQGSDAETSVSIPKCDVALFNPTVKDCGSAAECPCWRIIPNPECKPLEHGSPYGLNILRKPGTEAPKGAVASAACATTPYKWGSPEYGNITQCTETPTSGNP
jgi:hypothetical protein